MRVISGKFKGRKLKFPQNKKTRPTASMVKEAVFAKLFNNVQGAVFLDAFCGSGQIGIEALSRGASKIFFIDDDFFALKLLRENLKDLKVEKDFEIFSYDTIKALKKINQKIDIVFLDPPYDFKDYDALFEVVKQRKILNADGVIVCEHSKNLDLNFEGFAKISVKSYGIKKVSFFEREI